MEDQVIPPDSTQLSTDPPMRPEPPPKPRRGRKAGQPPATHNVAVPAESLAPIYEVASLTGQKSGDLTSSFREFLATALPGLAVQFATQALADFESRLAAKKAEMQAAAGGGE